MKPASLTPATAHALTEIIHEAGFPKGVFNLILGGGAMGGALTEHPDVAGISFTGGQSTGAQVAKAAMSHNARVQLEMGGKNPLVVLDDCDLDRAVQCALDGAFFATGQRCTASSRIIVTQNIHDKFVEALAAQGEGTESRQRARRRHADGPAREPGAARHHSFLCGCGDQARWPPRGRR